MTDTERLEWLVKNECYPMRTKRGWCLTAEGNVCLGSEHDDWRDAIDKAMENEK